MASALPLLLLLAASAAPAGPGPRATRVRLTDGGSGRLLASEVLCPGERAVLRWRNSLYGVDVTETFEARAGGLRLTGVAFALPGGAPPPPVRAEEVDELYHTGGPFRAEGLDRPVERVTFRVGEIGRPRLTLGRRTVSFLDEVGFGGAVRLQASAADPGARSCPAR